MIHLKTRAGKFFGLPCFVLFLRHMYAICLGNNFDKHNFKHLRHFIVQREVADFITSISLVKTEPGIVN